MEKIIISEINRMRSMMGLKLITEGNIFTEASNIWKAILSKEATSLSTEEREILQGLMSRVSEFSSNGIRSVDDLMTAAGKNVLRNVLEDSGEVVARSLRDSISSYQKKAITGIMSNAARDANFRNALRANLGGGQPGTIQDVLNRIETRGIDSVTNLDTLEATMLRLKSLTGLSAEGQRWRDDLIEQINNNLDTRAKDFEKQASEFKVPTSVVDDISDFGDEAIDDIVNALRKEYPLDFQDFERKLNQLNLTGNIGIQIRNRMIVGFKEYRRYTIKQLSKEVIEVRKILNLEKYAKYGALKKLFYKAATGELAISRIVWTSTTTGLVIMGCIILWKLGFWGYDVADEALEDLNKAAEDAGLTGEDESNNNETTSEPTIDKFTEFIKSDWGVDYNGNETFRKDGNIFIVNDGSQETKYGPNPGDYSYEYKNGTFKPIQNNETN